MNFRLTNRFRDIEEVRQNWGWFLALGILLIVVGIFAISCSVSATLYSIVFLGFILIAAGVVQIVQSVMARKWSGFFLSLLLGLLYILTGLFCVARPALAAVNLTLWIAGFFFIAGLFRMLSAVIIRFDQWGWVFLNGLVTFILGVMIYNAWPVSGLWVIGLFVGIDMILSGWSWIILAMSSSPRKDNTIEPSR